MPLPGHTSKIKIIGNNINPIKLKNKIPNILLTFLLDYNKLNISSQS